MFDKILKTVELGYIKQVNAYIKGDLKELSPEAVRWLEGLRLKPTEPHTLYRGFFFVEGSHTSLVRDAKRRGQKIVVRSGNLSSWTSILGTARRYALNSAEMDFRDGRRDFLDRNSEKDDPTGVVVTADIPPDLIIVSINKLAAQYPQIDRAYGNEWEYLIKPCQLDAKLMDLYTYKSLLMQRYL